MGTVSVQAPGQSEERTLRILSLDGGGYLGLATASFLREVEEYFDVALSEEFDFFAGTSTGSIMACSFAAGLRAGAIADLYERLGPDVFPPTRRRRGRLHRWARMAKMCMGSLYGNAELRSYLEVALGDTTLRDVLQRGKYLLVPTFCLSTGSPAVFKTDHSKALKAHGGYRLRDIALASSAAPVYLPLVNVNIPGRGATQTYCDGGVVANHPALLALIEAVYEIGAPRVSVLSVSTPRVDFREETTESHKLRRGLLGWRESLSDVFIGSNMSLAHQLMLRLQAVLRQAIAYERVELPNPHALGIDDASPRAKKLLIEIGVEQGRARTTRAQVKTVLSRTETEGA